MVDALRSTIRFAAGRHRKDLDRDHSPSFTRFRLSMLAQIAPLLESD
jgi:hypothetical protein